MKIPLFKKAPSSCYLAFSGGVDSVVLLNLLLDKKVDVKLLTVDHRTDYSLTEINFASDIADIFKLDLITETIPEYDKSTSLESFWSRKRNNIFQSLDKPVLTGHHLNDAVEWYLMTACQGEAKLLRYQNQNVYRPLITTSKKNILQYANERKLVYLTDPNNADSDFNLRNKVRNTVLPVIKTAFPGIEKTVRKLILQTEN